MAFGHRDFVTSSLHPLPRNTANQSIFISNGRNIYHKATGEQNAQNVLVKKYRAKKYQKVTGE